MVATVMVWSIRTPQPLVQHPNTHRRIRQMRQPPVQTYKEVQRRRKSVNKLPNRQRSLLVFVQLQQPLPTPCHTRRSARLFRLEGHGETA